MTLYVLVMEKRIATQVWLIVMELRNIQKGSVSKIGRFNLSPLRVYKNCILDRK
jgi:hypothetical protein